jgi:phospholipase C
MAGGSLSGMSRREFLTRAAGAGGAGLLMDMAGPVLDKAYGAGPCSGHLADVEHIVLFMQENRSFDHYFGTLSGTEGFDAPTALFQQRGWNPQTRSSDPTGVTIPYRFDTTRGPLLGGECVNDPDHGWVALHESWNKGANDNWLPAQATSQKPSHIPTVMGYYTRKDLPVQHLLADAFTVCDHYHCSVLGPTLPNRLYWLSASLGAEGAQGGPQVESPVAEPLAQFRWTTMPEHLSAAGVSWKVYRNKQLGPYFSSIISYGGFVSYFRQAQDPASDLSRYGTQPTYPADFAADVKANTLPAVSWVIPIVFDSEHPAFMPSAGALALVNLIKVLMANPAVWEKTALILSYDENGGFFDHVVPPTAPPGTAGEYLTAPNADSVNGSGGIAGPIGLGFRVPCMVISPYSRGGLMVHDVFDHTSQLRLIERRFGVPVPNLTSWRRSVTGDMTSTFNFAAAPNPAGVNIEHPALNMVTKYPQCIPNVLLGTGGLGIPYPVPYPQSMPTQETTPTRGIPSGIC